MPITTEIRDRVAEIVFDVPPVNAFDSETWLSLPSVISAAASNPEVNCVLIRAAEAGQGARPADLPYGHRRRPQLQSADQRPVPPAPRERIRFPSGLALNAPR